MKFAFGICWTQRAKLARWCVASPGKSWTKMKYWHLPHGYFDVDYDILWQILTVSVPELIVHLEELVPPASQP